MGRLLLTGASGGLGFHAVQRTVRDGWRVTALVRPTTDLDALRSLGIEETLLWSKLEAADLAPFDALVHLAGYVHQNSLRPNYAEHHRRFNHRLPVDLARLAVEAKVPHFIFASTIAVYGRFRTGWVDATTEPAPSEAYGASKRAAEIDLADLVEGSSTQLTTLRLPMVYGPRVKGNLLPLLRMAARQRRLPLGGAQGRRSFLYAGNFADALSQCLQTSPEPGRRLLYLLSDGSDLTSQELYDVLFRAFSAFPDAVTGGHPGTYPFPTPLLRLGGMLGSQVERLMGRRLPLSTATMRRLFEELRVDSEPFTRDHAWTPPYSPEEGLRLTAEWFQESEG